ncbi:MAG TPA: ferrous iron transport protein A [Anaerovoracaceae bacterium]|nr:ferrous iron transport protein A [Anaerovoracaceae bacterium]
MKTLKNAKIGTSVSVKKVHGVGPIRKRILDMGITKGSDIYVKKVAPLGDPIEVTIRNYNLSIRNADAELIELL